MSVGLSSNLQTAWDYCSVSIYNNVNQTNPYGSNTQRQGALQGSIPTRRMPSASTSANDLIYAVAVSQKTGCVLGGNLSTNPPFTLIEAPINYFLVEDLQVDTTTASQAVLPAATASSRANWYFFAMLRQARSLDGQKNGKMGNQLRFSMVPNLSCMAL
jgi:hypothetical protein